MKPLTREIQPIGAAENLIRKLAMLMTEGCSIKECARWLDHYRPDLEREIKRHCIGSAYLALQAWGYWEHQQAA